MFIIYLRSAWRTLLRNKLFITINVAGLTLGTCACIVIYTIASYELSFDRFHPGTDRIYRVMGDVTESTGDKVHFGRVPLAVSTMGSMELTGLDGLVAAIPYNAKINVPETFSPGKIFESRKNGSHFTTTAIANTSWFQIFPYKWLAGNASEALSNPFSIVLTNQRARQYFGMLQPDEFMGKKLIVEDSLQLTVTGIVQEWDQPTDLSFSDFISFPTLQSSFLSRRISTISWRQNAMSAWIFVKLSKGINRHQVQASLSQMVSRHAEQEVKLSLWLQPLSELHFNSDVIENTIRTAHKPTLYSLVGVAAFILLLAAINFINLSTAQSIKRAKEVGVRKVLGSSRKNLIYGFLTETIITTIISVFIAVLLVRPVLNLFVDFIPPGISFNLFQTSTIVFIGSLIIATSLLAGLYPSFVLSSALPVVSLRGTHARTGRETFSLRKGLMVFQFAVSLIFIIGSIITARQLRYTVEKDPGFNSEAIIIIDAPRGDSLSKLHVFEQQTRQITGVSITCRQWLPPMTDNPREMKLKLNNTDQKDFWVKQVAGDENFISLYKIKLLAGNNLMPSDTVKEFLVNESLASLMGYQNPSDALGKTLYWNDKPYPVAGVVADFNINSLHQSITPACIIHRADREGSMAVKFSPNDSKAKTIRSSINQLASAWKAVYPSATFNYRFYDESIALLYEKDQQTSQLVNTATIITLLISCFGLFGIILFICEYRRKEISIRKVLGAGVPSIFLLLTKEFIVLTSLALLLATPVAWYFVNGWLQTFAYRVHFSVWDIIAAGAVLYLITLLTISFQSLQAALANPVKSLHTE